MSSFSLGFVLFFATVDSLALKRLMKVLKRLY
jgi:hypothetical protein